jgi:hypothetical protein
MNDQLREWVHLFAIGTGQDEAVVVTEMEFMLRNCSFLRLDSFGLSSALVREQYNRLHTPGVNRDLGDDPAFEQAVTAVALERIWVYRAVVDAMAAGYSGDQEGA